MNGAAASQQMSLRKRDAVFWWRVFFVIAAIGFSFLLILQPPPWQILDEAGGDRLNIAQLVYVGTWAGGAGAIVLIAFLFALCPWWARAAKPETSEQFPVGTPRWFWPLVLAAVVAGGAIAAPTLNHSLWDDEHESLVWYVLGRYVRQPPDGHVQLKEHNWRRTVFAYSTPNNHIFHNILARTSNTLWRAMARPEGLQFNEVALRLPAFIGGLLCIAALAFLLKDAGFTAAGVLASWFLALQPWFTQHMALARGYTLTMLFAVLAVVFWRRALVSGAWLWWSLFAVCQFLGIWTYPAVFFLFAALNIALMPLVVWPAPGVAGPVRTMLSRWFCCTALACAGLLPLIAPLVPQIRVYIATLNGGGMGIPWLESFFSFLAGGAAWDNGSLLDHSYQDLQLVVSQSGGTAMLWALLVVTAILFILGLVRFARSGVIAATAAACVVAGPVIHWLYAELKGIVLWEWYLIYALPFVCLFWGVGLWVAAAGVAKILRAKWAGSAFAVLVVAFYAFATSPVRAWQLAHSRVPYRESTNAARAGAEGARAIVFGTTGAALGYDPEMFFLERPLDLAVLMMQADAEKRPLIANMGQMETLRSSYPKIYALLENRALFPQVEQFKGFFSGGDRFVCRYAPGSVASFDFAGILTAEELAYATTKAQMTPEVYFTGRERRNAAQDAGGYGPPPGAGKEPNAFRK